MNYLNRPAPGPGREAPHAAVVCLAIVAASLPAAGYCQSSAETSWEAIKTCATIKEDKPRFTCYDAVVRGAGLLPSAAELHRDTFGLPANAAGPAPKAADAPAAPPAPAPVAVAPKSAAAATPPAHDKLDVVIANVDQGHDGKFTVTTTEGAVWRQIESVTLHQPPLKGDTMIISQGVLGGFMCKSSKYVTFRCQRLR